MTRPLYFLPGRGARISGRLGSELTQRGYTVTGRSLHQGFEALAFSEQLTVIRDDLTARHWAANSVIVAHSYGAHLCLSSLMGLPPFPGTLALVSPAYRKVRHGFSSYRVPGAKALAAAIDQGQFPRPTGRVGVVSGDNDWQVPIEGVVALDHALGAQVQWIKAGHELPPTAVQAFLSQVGV